MPGNLKWEIQIWQQFCNVSLYGLAKMEGFPSRPSIIRRYKIETTYELRNITYII